MQQITLVALAPSDAVAPSPPPPAPTNRMQDLAGKLDHGKEAGIKLSMDSKERQTQVPRSSSSCLGTK